MKDEKDIAKELSDKELKGAKWDLKARELGLKPGQLVPGTQSWVPWIKEDLDPTDTVTFVCQDVLGTQGGNYYYDGGRGFILDVNGLTCSFHVGKLNTVNNFFYSRYESMVEGNIQLEKFKRGGPQHSPWDTTRWMYIPYATSFGFDIDGRALKDPKWYELDSNGLPIKINNIKKLASLYFEGDLDFTFTNTQLLELVFSVYKVKIINKIKKTLRRK